MIIRQEAEKDYHDIYRLIIEVFKTAEHADGNEQDLVNALRKSDAFVPELSLVAEISGELVGHILFSEAKVGKDTVLVLAPLSVKPEFQRQGIGSALVKTGHKIAAILGYSYSFVLGSELYYPRFGYLPAANLGVEIPKGIPTENFMAIKLKENVKPISGKITYAKEFGL